jgi:predicted RNase H-like HicB family nuclease
VGCPWLQALHPASARPAFRFTTRTFPTPRPGSGCCSAYLPACGVTVPDLPGCYSAGETMEETLTSAVEAIECHLEGMLLDGGTIPEAQPVEMHQKNRKYAKGTRALVSVDLSKLASKAKRINITLPERVLALVDEQAKRAGVTRSGLLARAALDYIGRNKVA